MAGRYCVLLGAGGRATRILSWDETPNPRARRFRVDAVVHSGDRGRYLTDPDQADHPVARALLELEGVTGVLLLADSITINVDREERWGPLLPLIEDALLRTDV